MILKIVDKNGNYIGGIYLYENNFNGEVEVMDEDKVFVKGFTKDTIFGTNEEEVIIEINKE